MMQTNIDNSKQAGSKKNLIYLVDRFNSFDTKRK